MTTDNTLLARCIAVYRESYQDAYYDVYMQHTGTETFERYRIADEKADRLCHAYVLHHLATEIAVMLERNPNLTPHQLITILRMEASGEFADWEQGQ